MSITVNFEQQILEEAAASPVVAIMRLTLEIDRELRKLLAVTGALGHYQGELPEAIKLLESSGELQLPRELKDTLTQFWSLRNQVVHSQISEHLALRALDYGLRILRLVKSIPRHSYVVYKSGVPLYQDAAGTQPRLDVRGVILETVSSNGESLRKQVFPTTKSYSPGESLSWEWNLLNKGWGETWYRDPDTMQVKPAWSASLEFTGRDLNEI
jgi:hypothetical protein